MVAAVKDATRSLPLHQVWNDKEPRQGGAHEPNADVRQTCQPKRLKDYPTGLNMSSRVQDTLPGVALYCDPLLSGNVQADPGIWVHSKMLGWGDQTGRGEDPGHTLIDSCRVGR